MNKINLSREAIRGLPVERPLLAVEPTTGKCARPTRHGSTMTELLVAATLLIGAMAFIGPLSVRSGRLRQDTRHYQSALEEVSNQLERLTTLEGDERTTALAELAPSQAAQSSLPNPQLSAETIDDADGLRIALQIQWDRLGKPKPLSLVAWIKPPEVKEEDQ
ncbi:type II secretion system protein [Bythopirellula polymerisocia]|uniref:Uncharacterized protein n=1 Tax=Bythopirellula polymerisocia TaxID=2528003 RepID=A0A5C6CW22_9BACT|nr:type II secretion system protein [Bythopirellula polymerisocia]TWU28055.1 hypothetical protein Pla144_13420 [Bythopirellula polymerisocia]